jgi:hypothetical protein
VQKVSDTAAVLAMLEAAFWLAAGRWKLAAVFWLAAGLLAAFSSISLDIQHT